MISMYKCLDCGMWLSGTLVKEHFDTIHINEDGWMISDQPVAELVCCILGGYFSRFADDLSRGSDASI